MIEEGRYRNIDRMDRICQYCNTNLVEDEYHFLLVCPAYREIRLSILPKYYCSWSSKQKFIKILNSSQTGILRKLAKYIYSAMKRETLCLNFEQFVNLYFVHFCLLFISFAIT